MARKMSSYTLRQLEGFIAVAEEANFSRAAERLDMSQPSLSRLINTLERHVNAPLFGRRRGTSPELTTAGKELLARARSLINEADDLGRWMNGSATLAEVAIAAPPYIKQRFLLDLFSEFQVENPQIMPTAVEGTNPEIARLVRQGAVCAGFHFAKGEESAGKLIVANLSNGLYVASGHLLAQRRAITLDDISHASFILPPEHSELETTILALLARLGVLAPRVQLRSPYFSAVRRMALESDGLLPILDDVVAEDVAAGRLVKLLDLPSSSIRQLTRTFPKLNPAERSLVQFVNDRLGRAMGGKVATPPRARLATSAD
jgi:DNA-binding transcriptional LysR family regulator